MKCETCDCPLATEEDWKTIPPGEGEHLCWGACEPEDWRTRALTAEQECKEAKALVESLYQECHLRTDERDEARAEAKELREILKTAGDRLRAYSYELTEFSYQELASVLFDLPRATEVEP